MARHALWLTVLLWGCGGLVDPGAGDDLFGERTDMAKPGTGGSGGGTGGSGGGGSTSPGKGGKPKPDAGTSTDAGAGGSGGGSEVDAGAGGSGGGTGGAGGGSADAGAGGSGGSSGLARLPLISRNKPAYANVFNADAWYAVNDNYNDAWRPAGFVIRTTTPAELAVDISSAPAAARQALLVHWTNDDNSNYDLSVNNETAYNLPLDYRIEVNSAPGGGAPPASGWVALATVTGNSYHSKQHLLANSGTSWNWVRMIVTASLGSTQNNDVAFNFDVYDASAGVEDSWLFLGDSITAGGMRLASWCAQSGCPSADGSFGQLVNRVRPSYTPAQDNGGFGGWTTADVLANIDRWMAQSPAHFVTLNFGTNHTWGGCDVSCANAYEADMRTLIQKVLAAGKVPVIPTIPWSADATMRTGIVALNTRIAGLYSAYPQVVRGPDLYTFFQNNPSLISGDKVHPTNAGYFRMKKLWADTVTAPGSVYGP